MYFILFSREKDIQLFCESFRLFNLWKMSRILYAHAFYSRYMLLILFSNLNTVFIILSRDNADTIWSPCEYNDKYLSLYIHL